MNMVLRILFPSLIFFSLGLAGLFAQDFSAFEKQIFHNEAGETLAYRVLMPANFDSTQQYPLLMFLHGAGERGTKNERQLTHGAELFLQPENRAKFPAIILFPQCPTDSNWYSAYSDRGKPASTRRLRWEQKEPTLQLRLAHELVQSFIQRGQVDITRVYLSGLSMGGFGTFEMLARYPDTFVAAAPICGGGDPEAVTAYAQKLPLWIFHGTADGVVPVKWSQMMYEALKEAGAEVKLTLYEGVNHNSWENAFAEPEYLPWLFEQRRK